MKRLAKKTFPFILLGASLVVVYLNDGNALGTNDRLYATGSNGSSIFNLQENDVIVVLHIPGTGMTSLSQSLVTDLVTETPCDCPAFKTRCRCKNKQGNPWLFHSYNSTGWVCGENAGWTNLTECPIDQWMENVGHDTRRQRRYWMITLLREPASRFVHEWHHFITRDAYFRNEPRLFRPESPELQKKELPCLVGKKIASLTLTEFLECAENPAINRMTRMLANLTEVNSLGYHGDKYNDALLKSAMTNLEELPFFGISENSMGTQGLLESILGLRFSHRLDILPTSIYRSIGEFNVAPALLRTVRSINNLDVRLYDHAIQLFGRQLAEMRGGASTPRGELQRSLRDNPHDHNHDDDDEDDDDEDEEEEEEEEDENNDERHESKMFVDESPLEDAPDSGKNRNIVFDDDDDGDDDDADADDDGDADDDADDDDDKDDDNEQIENAGEKDSGNDEGYADEKEGHPRVLKFDRGINLYDKLESDDIDDNDNTMVMRDLDKDNDENIDDSDSSDNIDDIANTRSVELEPNQYIPFKGINLRKGHRHQGVLEDVTRSNADNGNDVRSENNPPSLDSHDVIKKGGKRAEDTEDVDVFFNMLQESKHQQQKQQQQPSDTFPPTHQQLASNNHKETVRVNPSNKKLTRHQQPLLAHPQHHQQQQQQQKQQQQHQQQQQQQRQRLPGHQHYNAPDKGNQKLPAPGILSQRHPPHQPPHQGNPLDKLKPELIGLGWNPVNGGHSNQRVKAKPGDIFRP